MENKKLGFLIIGSSIIAGFVMFSYIGSLGMQGTQLNCNPTNECKQVNSLLGLSHITIGFLAFISSLGFYLLLFDKGEQAILKRLEEEKNIDMENNRFEAMLIPMDGNEKAIITAIKNQEGITQSTLKFRVNLSKAKVSQVLTHFEKNKLIVRNAKGNTYEIFLRDGVASIQS